MNKLFQNEPEQLELRKEASKILKEMAVNDYLAGYLVIMKMTLDETKSQADVIVRTLKNLNKTLSNMNRVLRKIESMIDSNIQQNIFEESKIILKTCSTILNRMRS